MKEIEKIPEKDWGVIVNVNQILEENRVLKRALKNTCWLLYGTYDEHYPNCFIKQAEKELKGEEV